MIWTALGEVFFGGGGGGGRLCIHNAIPPYTCTIDLWLALTVSSSGRAVVVVVGGGGGWGQSPQLPLPENEAIIIMSLLKANNSYIQLFQFF